MHRLKIDATIFLTAYLEETSQQMPSLADEVKKSPNFKRSVLRGKAMTSVDKMSISPLFHDFYRITDGYAKLFNCTSYVELINAHNQADTDRSNQITKTMEALIGPHKHTVFKLLLEKAKRTYGLDTNIEVEDPV